MRAPSSTAVAGALLAAAGVARATGALLRRAGATRAEHAGSLPGDEVVVSPDSVTTRARTLGAPPARVWPWLVQLGWGRAGWYSLDALEALLGAARSTAADGTTSWRSLREVVPAHQHLAVCDRVPLSPSAGFDVVSLEPGRHLVLALDAGAAGWSFAWSWAFVLEPLGESATRLLVRTRVAVRPRVLAPVVTAGLDPGHAVMELAQLRNLAARVEGR